MGLWAFFRQLLQKFDPKTAGFNYHLTKTLLQSFIQATLKVQACLSVRWSFSFEKRCISNNAGSDRM